MHNQDDNLKTMLRMENLQKIKRKIVVMSGKGGVGKSTVSVNLAYALALQGNRVGIMDVDIHGPSIAKMTGIEDKKLLVENENDRPKPIEVVHNLYVLSLASMLDNPDDAIIWRGPMKIGLIQQFLEDIEWPQLDYLVVDCPPGTGDEPLSVIQLLGNIEGVIIVSTPQDVAFLDARKSINFAKKLEVNIIGIVENMAGFVCPKCGENIDIFKSGGAKKTAKDFNIDILGEIPLDPNIVHSGDDGKPYVYHYGKTKGGKIFMDIAERVIEKIETQKTDNSKKSNIDKIAIPIEDGKLCEHFGHAPKFGFYYIEGKDIVKYEEINSPEHEHGSIPKWLKSLDVTKIITGGIGGGAVNFLNQFKIQVFSGVESDSHEEIIKKFLNNELKSGGGSNCNHNHSGDHNCHNH